MSSIVNRAKAGIDTVGSKVGGLMDSLPVIGDYRSKEMRREADKRLREGIAKLLETYRSKLTGLERDLVNAGRLRDLPGLERAVGRLQLLIDKIRTAAYGYAPFFDLDKVREPELERLAASTRPSPIAYPRSMNASPCSTRPSPPTKAYRRPLTACC